MGSSYWNRGWSLRKSVNSSLKWGREAAGLTTGAGRFPLPYTILCWVLLCDALSSGAVLVVKFICEIMGVKRRLSREDSWSWGLLCSAHAQVQYLENPFHLLNTKQFLVFQCLFQQALILNLSCHKSWLKGIWCSCFSYIVAHFYRNILFLFYKCCLDSCYEMSINPFFVLQFLFKLSQYVIG